MSLQTDKIFIAALMSSGEILSVVTSTGEARIYNTAIPLPDEDADNVPAPYIIVTNNGMTNDQTTKDDYEGDTDTVHIGIEVVAITRGQLATLMEKIREVVRDYFINYDREEGELADLVPLDYQVSATPIQYDAYKPCYYQALNYECDTNV